MRICWLIWKNNEDIDRRLIQHRLILLNDRKLLIDMFAERTAYTACSPQSVFGIAPRVRNAEHFFIVTLIAVCIPKDRAECIAPL